MRKNLQCQCHDPEMVEGGGYLSGVSPQPIKTVTGMASVILKGLLSKLDYIASLGVDVVWPQPCL